MLFLAYSGEMRWRTRAGDEVAARLGEDVGPDATAQALRTALDPKGEWIASVLAAADRRLERGASRGCRTPVVWSSPPTTSTLVPTPDC